MSISSSGGVPPPPDPLLCNTHVLPAGTILHRIHDARFSARTFNPGLGYSRFAPFAVAGEQVSTAYCATSLECTAFETIFHDINASAAFKSVRWSALVPLRYSQLGLARDISLASLFSADLMKLGLERKQIIDTPKSTYAATQAWSPAIHAAANAPEGIVWVSRRYDQEKALMLFGDRVSGSAFEHLGSVGVTTDADVLKCVVDLAARAGVVITR